MEEVHPDATFLVNFKEYFEERQGLARPSEGKEPGAKFLKKVTSYFFENSSGVFLEAQNKSRNNNDKSMDEVKQSEENGKQLLGEDYSKSVSLNHSLSSVQKKLRISSSEEMYQFLQNIEVQSCIWPRLIPNTMDFKLNKSTKVTDIINVLFTEDINFNELSVTESRLSISRISGSFRSVKNFDLLNMKRKRKTIDRLSTVIKGTYNVPNSELRIPVAMKMSKFFYDGMPWIFIFFQDSTQKVENKYLKELDKFKDKLLATVTHDLRTPLNLIIVMLENARTSRSREALINSLNLAEVNANLLHNLISDILDHSLFKENKIKLIVTEFSLNHLVSEIIHLFEFQAAQKHVQLKYLKNFVESDIMMISDCRRMKQIIINLVSNSLKFTSKGLITIHIQEIDTYDDVLLVEVIDTGSGIKRENMNKLFRPFATFENQVTLYFFFNFRIFR